MIHHSIPRIPLTASKYTQLQSDFSRLKIEREQVMERLKVAREMGDLSENGAYQYAKFELGSIRRQLREIRHLLQLGEVVEKSADDDCIGFGSQVTLDDGSKQNTYLLVSQHESDPVKRKLSMESPIGSAILGKKVGDKVTVATPRGEVVYTIQSVTS